MTERRGTNKQLVAGEKVRLMRWVLGQRELCEKSTVDQLIEQYKKETGVDVSRSTMMTYRREVYPEMRNEQRKNAVRDLGLRVAALEQKVATLEGFKLHG